MPTQELQRTEPSITRRRFMAWAGWGSFVSFFGATALGTMRFLFPGILYEPAARFQAGKLEDFQIDKVSTRFKKAQRVWMIRTPEGMYALIAICTHLGCTPNWFAREGRCKCPCHGSNFLLDGTNVAGPAPVPLYRATIALDLSGTIIVDKSQQENRPGKRDTPPFFLPLPMAEKPAA